MARKGSVFCLVRSEAQKLKKFSGQLTKSLLKGSTMRFDFGRVGAGCRNRVGKPKFTLAPARQTRRQNGVPPSNQLKWGVNVETTTQFCGKAHCGRVRHALGNGVRVTAVQAQVTTAVRGTVVNQQQQPVAGASVRITHTPSGTVSLATSSESGVFLLAGCGSADLTQSRFQGAAFLTCKSTTCT